MPIVSLGRRLHVGLDVLLDYNENAKVAVAVDGLVVHLGVLCEVNGKDSCILYALDWIAVDGKRTTWAFTITKE